MIVSQVFEGVGLGAWGVVLYAWSRWYVRDDERLRKMAQSRWRWDLFTTRKLRRDEISQEEWFDQFVKRERANIRWGFTPFIILWLVVCVAMTIHGLLSHG